MQPLGADKKLISAVNLFDVYEGEHLEPGKKSVAFEVVLQPKDKTLTDEDIEEGLLQDRCHGQEGEGRRAARLSLAIVQK